LLEVLAIQIAHAVHTTLVVESDLTHHRIAQDRQLSSGLSRKHLDVGRIVLSRHVAASHAIAAVMARGSLVTGTSQCGFANVNDANAEFGATTLDDAVRAPQRHWGKKPAIRKVL